MEHIGNSLAKGEYFQPRNMAKAPLAILVHGWGARSLIPCKLLARSLTRRGIACFILYLVFHSSRLPEDMKKRLPRLTPEEWFNSYQLSVIDVRQIVDWANTREDIDARHIAVVGISLGGFVSAIAMGVDSRITSGVFLVAGGNSEKMMHKSRLNSFRKDYRRTETEYIELQNQYMQYLNEVVEKGFENITPPRKSFLTDPLTFASRIRERPILMLNALWDEIIPKEATLDFWEACDRPRIKWFPATHASIWLWYPMISREIADFLGQNLRNKS
jgi:esterase/lipase